MKILSVFGTRPEAIKMAPVVRELHKRSATSGLQSVVCVTAQHREMLDQVWALFDIEPDCQRPPDESGGLRKQAAS